VSVDHVPPKQFFAPNLRKGLNLSKLVTLPAHGACNEAYSHDEEYLTWALSAIAIGSPPADAVVAYHAAKTMRGQSRPLAQKIMGHFDHRPSGLYLPRGLVTVRLEGDRIKRVLWKIVRGLHMIEHSEFIAEDELNCLELIEPESDPSDRDELWERVKAEPSLASYAGVFDYKYLYLAVGDQEMHVWGMLLWDRVMAFVAHEPGPPPHSPTQ